MRMAPYFAELQMSEYFALPRGILQWYDYELWQMPLVPVATEALLHMFAVHVHVHLSLSVMIVMNSSIPSSLPKFMIIY